MQMILRHLFSSKGQNKKLTSSPARTHTNAFNPDTKAIFSPLVSGNNQLSKKKLSVNQKLQSMQNANKQANPWVGPAENQRSNLIRMKSAFRRSDQKPGIQHSQSIDLGSTKRSTLSSTFTSGFASTRGSEGFKPGSTKSSLKDTFYSTRSLSKSYTRRYGKYKMKQNVPTYDFTGGDSPWLNQSRVNNKIAGKEQNFKINYMNYDTEFNSARPVAHTKGRKFCPITRYMKDLQDNRIFNRGKMATYRGDFK